MVWTAEAAFLVAAQERGEQEVWTTIGIWRAAISGAEPKTSMP